MPAEEIIQRMSELAEKLLLWQSQYAQGRPTVSDLEYDKVWDDLRQMEEQNPEQRLPWSPTQRVGSDLSHGFPERAHEVPVLSLDKAYAVSELEAWLKKNQGLSSQPLVVVAEQKLDGLSVVLYYENGILERALTRGNGWVGNDVTANIKTIPTVPLKLEPGLRLAVRGEVYLPKSQFSSINARQEEPYANARNLAAGTLRRVKSRETAEVPLHIFCYEAFFLAWPGQTLPSGHLEALAALKTLGFPVNAPIAALSPEGQFTGVQRHSLELLSCRGIPYAELGPLVEDQTRQRPTLDWDIDGLVLKVDALNLREELGATEHHPRWAMAYKFESPQGETKVEEITVQVGRTGRVTPVARVSPVAVGGSTITFVTLHNEGFIEGLELNIGDIVAISRRGDVIPAVERVVEKLTPGTWKFPEFCPSCGSCLRKEGAHAFCPQPDCPDQKRYRLIFFAGKDQMDIENLGPETVDTLISLGLVNDPSDFFTCDYDKLLDVAGFGPKKVELIRAGVEKARKQPFVRVLTALGIPDLGPKLAQLLIEAGLKSYAALREALENRAQELVNLPGVGERTVESLKLGLLKPSVSRLIDKLTQAGLVMEAQAPRGPENTAFAGTVWCVTGSFEKFQPRALAEEEILKRAGRVVSAVSGATTHLLAGSGAGSKLQKAQSLGVRVVSEQAFLTALAQERVPGL